MITAAFILQAHDSSMTSGRSIDGIITTPANLPFAVKMVPSFSGPIFEHYGLRMVHAQFAHLIQFEQSQVISGMTKCRAMTNKQFHGIGRCFLFKFPHANVEMICNPLACLQ